MKPEQKLFPILTPLARLGRQLVKPMLAAQAYLLVGSIVVSARTPVAVSNVIAAAATNPEIFFTVR